MCRPHRPKKQLEGSLSSHSLNNRRLALGDQFGTPAGRRSEIAQTVENGRGQHFPSGTPAPVAFGSSRLVHSALDTEIQEILEGSDGQARPGRPREPGQFPGDFTGTLPSGANIIPYIAASVLGQ